MKHIDENAAISARRHCRGSVVTASNDGVHFHRPIQRDDIVRLESYVCSVGRTSMEIFVKILTEDCSQEDVRHVAAVSFLTFVGLDQTGKPTEVPMVIPESEEEQLVHEVESKPLFSHSTTANQVVCILLIYIFQAKCNIHRKTEKGSVHSS